MRYESAKTPKGNVGVSHASQQAADDQAASMDASNCYDCSDCSDCSDCYDCYDCSRCSGCSRCSRCSDWGVRGVRLLQMSGLLWQVTTDGVELAIGCQRHPVAKWESFSDKAIALMDSEALEFWIKYKSVIMTLAKLENGND